MIELKSIDEIKKMKMSAEIVAEVLQKLKETAKPGMNTMEFDEEAKRVIGKHKGAKPAFLGYRGFPATVCVSINSEVVHGIPKKERIIKEGDIVSVDFGIEKEGYFGDAALTISIGKIDAKAKELMKATKGSLDAGIEKARPGNRLGDISSAVQKYAEGKGFSVVRDFVGHGIGKKLHEDPMIPNYGEAGKGPELKAGMVLAIEPMVNAGGYEVEVQSDDWTVVTKDRSLSAHFEHTVAITEKGPVILSVFEA